MCILHQIVEWVAGVYTSDCRADGWCGAQGVVRSEHRISIISSFRLR